MRAAGADEYCGGREGLGRPGAVVRDQPRQPPMARAAPAAHLKEADPAHQVAQRYCALGAHPRLRWALLSRGEAYRAATA